MTRPINLLFQNSRKVFLLATVVLAAATCGGEAGNFGGDGDGDGDGDAHDGSVGDGDVGNADCTPGATQCSNCIDDDGDGRVDGADIHCVSAADNDESSFETGIPGDNVDIVKQDCFFDGDSGAGNDGCDLHICCILGAANQVECESFADSLGLDLKPNLFDPNDCTPSAMCIEECRPLTTPGCDCFSCCTLCDGPDCTDVLTHPDAAPDCDIGSLDDPTVCPPCTKVAECENPCDDPCVLCPGQDESDLPSECGGNNTCVGDSTPCDATNDCGIGEFCSTGCCVPQID